MLLCAVVLVPQLRLVRADTTPLSFSGGEKRFDTGGNPNLAGWTISSDTATLFAQVNVLGMTQPENAFDLYVEVYAYFTPSRTVDGFTISAEASPIAYEYIQRGISSTYNIGVDVTIYGPSDTVTPLGEQAAFSDQHVVSGFTQGTLTAYPSINVAFGALTLQAGTTYRITFGYSVGGDAASSNFFYSGNSYYDDGSSFANSYTALTISSPRISFTTSSQGGSFFADHSSFHSYASGSNIQTSLTYSNSLGEDVTVMFLVSIAASGHVVDHFAVIAPNGGSGTLTATSQSLPFGTYDVSWMAFRASDTSLSNAIDWSISTEDQTITISGSSPGATQVTFTVDVVDSSSGTPISGAAVILDGHFDGSTNFNGNLGVSTTYPPADHSYSVSANGYQTETGTWTIGSDSGGYITVRLMPSYSPPPPQQSTHTISFSASYVSGDVVTRNVYYSLDGSSDALLGTVDQSGDWTLTATFTTVHIYVNVNPGTIYYEQLYIDGRLVASGNVGNEGLSYTVPSI